ncbi:MAG TPA: hypothetical protein VLV29_06890 [Steroidobacteraceae bacterium]|nr:hypothetical protein [Steroidobacteraceae bacterium]
MSAVLLAVFKRFTDAERVRTSLVRDGFPTDRVELTARTEPGRAGELPAGSARQQFEQYFGTLFDDDHERGFVQAIADRVECGSIATVAVHPRGDIETARATQILQREGASEVVSHDLESQAFEFAASSAEVPMVGHLLPRKSDNECFYCWLFPEEAQRH